MSVQDVKKIRSAYEKMLEDGSAFKEVDMSMMTEPNVAMAEGSPLGDVVTETPTPHQPIEENHVDYSAHDDYMQQRINSLRNKMKGSGNVNEGGGTRMSKELTALKKRVKKLEEALMLVMETHERLL